MKKITLLVYRFALVIFFSALTNSTISAQCSSSGNNSDGYNTGTRQVIFNTINNSTPIEDNDYSDFTSISTTVTQSAIYNLSVYVNTDGAYTTRTRAWVDWNQDGDFIDAGELYNLGTAYNVANGITSLSPLSITIPAAAALGNTTMRVSTKYSTTPSSCETGFDGEVEDYTINVVAATPQPEINITGNAITINSGDTTPAAADDTEFGSTAPGSPISNTFTIQNTGSLTLTVGTLSLSGANPGDFSISTTPAGTVAASGNTTFTIDFDPTANGTRTAILSIVNNDADENPYTFTIQGTGVVPLTEGPGGVTADLELWLKDTAGLGYTDGQSVSLWADQGRGADATVNTTGQEPTYYDNATRNINFNPVVEFDNTYSSFSLDSDYSYDDTSTEFLEGTSGMYTQDIFLVIIPDDTPINSSFGFMDVFCGDADAGTNATDATGIGFGDYTGRISNESIAFAIDTYDTGVPGDGYAVQDGPGTSYDNVGIINARNNTAVTQQELYYNANNIETNQNDIASFVNVNDSRYWIGRSEGWEATVNARIAEVITFSSRKADVNLTQERNRIQSYLAIKYGITLGANGTSQDYVDSDGTVIWDSNTGVPANDVFNYDIAGIGRDDDSDLLQKQSRSVNNDLDGATRGQGVLTMGISSIYDTNNLNPSTDLNDKEFLIWGNDGVDLDDPAVVVNIDMSSAITPAIAGGTFVEFNGIARTWKVVENGGDIPSVEVAVLQSAVRTATPPNGVYLMFISNSPNFGPTADYRVMTESTNELGEAILETDYDFDGIKYITFGWAPERVYTRSVYFNGTSDYIDIEDNLDLNPTEFTISAWINRESGSTNKSILSKRDASFSEGYDFKINASGHVEMSWKDGAATRTVTSSVPIPEDEWHQVAVIYGSGTATLYIDGIEDTSASLSAPSTTTHSFFIAAAAKSSPTAFFQGNIDEVRVWDAALTATQLRYIMNQEIEDNSNFVGGKYFITNSITPTKDDVSSLPWADLAGYYPMTTYTYTNTKDESGNGNKGALRNLRTVDRQTAPLPYISAADGDWTTKATWENGTLQTIPGTTSIVDNTKTVDWNIVVTNHNVTMVNSSLPSAKNDNRSVLALLVESNELTVDGNNSGNGNGLTVTHYLTLDGKIDLEGESQLIQSTDSDLDVTSAGTIERDQQGTQDFYTYNYWSSPVGVSNTTTNNNSYTLNDNIFKDGTNPAAPVNINFVSGYDGSLGTPIQIADYWIWKFGNLADDYYNWQHVRRTGTISPGEGFTMKGVNDTSNNVSLLQNYVIEGKPNNGDISLPIDNNNDYLVGNPYASAIDANTFILDNTDTTGAIYLWEHFGGGTHTTIGYQGGYAVYNLSGGVQAIQYDFVTGGNDPSGGTGTKTPGRYIPVAQGFFVIGSANGTINFNNGQRLFQKEDATSVFVRNSTARSSYNEANDDRLKMRIGFKSANAYTRQLLVTRDSQATSLVDFGFDAKYKDEQSTDMFWMIDEEKFVIQGINTIDTSSILPIGITTSESGVNTLKIDSLLNFPDDLQVYVHDTELGTYHNLRSSDFEIDLPAGEYLNRFRITFTNQALSTEEFENDTNLNVYFANDSESIVINNPNLISIANAEIVNMIGQSVYKYDAIELNDTVELKTKNISTGAYIIKLKTENGIISKKVLVN